MKRTTLSIFGIVGLVIVLLLVNAISRNVFSRFYFDFTEDGLYSLTSGTKNIVRSIQQPITLKYYFSRTDGSRYPSIKLYGTRILDLLKQYERAGEGKIRLEIYDPRPDTEEEEWADKYGLTPIPGQVGEKLYLGLAGVNALGQEEALPLFNFSRQEFLEYDISRVVSSLLSSKKPIIGVISSIDVLGSSLPEGYGGEGSDGWFAFTQLKQGMDVRKIETEATAIDKDINLIVVVHPKKLGDQTQFALDQFVMRGGRLIVLVDPFAQADQPSKEPQNAMEDMMASKESSLNRLLTKWGVESITNHAVADIDLAARVEMSRQGQGQKPFVLWPNLTAEQMNREDVATNRLENVVLPWAGELKITKTEGVTTEVLLKSSKSSQSIEEKDYRFGGGDPDGLIRTFNPSGEERVLAVRLTGKFKSNFPDGAPKKEGDPEPTAEAKAELLKESSGVSNVIVIGDVDFLSDKFSVQVQQLFGTKIAQLLNDNQNLFQNLVENMLGSDDLISIRSRGQFTRPFSRVQRMEATAQQRWQQEEMVLQATLNGANQRLGELQAKVGGDSGGNQVLNKALLEEIKKFKEEKNDAQKRLRDVRKNLRQDIESLGGNLFVLNTFFVPTLLIVGALVLGTLKNKR